MFARWLLALLALVLLALVGARPFARLVDARINAATHAGDVPVSAAAAALHARLWIADLHCDAILWDRDLLARNPRGLVDLPRLLEGNVALEAFSVATSQPLLANYRRTPDLLDVMPVLAMASRWPARTWFDPYQRARFLSARLRRAAHASQGRLTLVASRADLDSLVARAPGRRAVGGLLLLEGLHPIARDPARVDTLFADGFRVFGIAHMFDNAVGGSAHGWRKYGLTPLGRTVVARLDSLHAIIDLAHASPAVIDDVLGLTSRPLLVSHTGIQSVCPGPRNLSDDQARRIAAAGGLIAIGFWNAAVCGADASAIARSIRRCADVTGIEHVAIGSDFDGAVRAPFDAARLALLTDALLKQGFSEAEIAGVMGGNALRFLREALPKR